MRRNPNRRTSPDRLEPLDPRRLLSTLIAEVDTGVYLPSVIYVLVILVLLLRPAGLFATRSQGAAERV